MLHRPLQAVSRGGCAPLRGGLRGGRIRSTKSTAILRPDPKEHPLCVCGVRETTRPFSAPRLLRPRLAGCPRRDSGPEPHHPPQGGIRLGGLRLRNRARRRSVCLVSRRHVHSQCARKRRDSRSPRGCASDAGWMSGTALPPNFTFDRTAGSHSLAAAGQRAR